MKDENGKFDFPRKAQIAVFVVAGIAVVAAVLHGIYPERVDQTTAMFLAVAIVTLLSHQITKFKGFGIEIEKEVDQLRKDVTEVENAFVGLEKDVGPGSKTAVAPMQAAPLSATRASTPAFNPEDPNKGMFGGSPESNGRKLSASIKPLAGPKSSRCRVEISVVSTDPKRPLVGNVIFHLHPTFGQWASYEVKANGGIAKDTISSYGAFTIGVEADGGATRLELDLVDVPGGTDAFYVS